MKEKFHSGGGLEKYKLLRTLYVEKESSHVYIDKDDNGNTFACDDIYIIGKCDTAVNTQIFYRLGNGSVGEKAQYHYHIAANNKSQNYMKCSRLNLKKIETNIYEFSAGASTTFVYDSSLQYEGPIIVSNNGYHDVMSETDKIKEVAIFYTGTTTMIPAGTTFGIYGK